ncbi:hypothetical protein EG68_06821 [Paragonimus skrjabini miyazakii]|uniref:DUF4806 domain-containing protein n=1 Tax=Paragonimus skrjabini miyazakii TaxID=59628 RepID=A0A8S9YM92_9TREM|nr:hypothetical protein EG68_06821 [Paragonimus skrjabini miyazakii]
MPLDTTTILDLVKGVVSTLSNITSRLQALKTLIVRSLPPPTSSRPTVTPVISKSPTGIQEKLDTCEAELVNSEVYEIVLNSLSRMGGTDVADTVRRIMSFLIPKDLAVSRNWTGVFNKQAAYDLLFTELIQGKFCSQSSL